MPIRVRATDVGWSGLKLVAIGEEFEISDESAFSPEWMERVEASASVVPETSEPSPDGPSTDVAPKRKAGRPPKTREAVI